jgi:hypothetical protein
MKPRGRVSVNWSSGLAYAIALIATDGNLSSDGRHISLTSKDLEQLQNFKKCLGIDVKIGYKRSGYSRVATPHIQFGDVAFYRFLVSIGLTRAKTRTISSLKIPDEYFFDFLRGHHDGDGSFYSYWDPRWKPSFMFYTIFLTSSCDHLVWLRQNIVRLLGIRGYVSEYKNRSKSTAYTLRFAKNESLKLLPKMYHSDKIICLTRKYLKVKEALKIEGEHARVL